MCVCVCVCVCVVFCLGVLRLGFWGGLGVCGLGVWVFRSMVWGFRGLDLGSRSVRVLQGFCPGFWLRHRLQTACLVLCVLTWGVVLRVRIAILRLITLLKPA